MHCSREEHLKKFKEEDLAKSLLLMICYDVSQIASLHAKRLSIYNNENCLIAKDGSKNFPNLVTRNCNSGNKT